MHLNMAHIKNIQKAHKEDRLAIFIGAGVSKSSDSEYLTLPSWADLISELKLHLGITEDLDYLKLAQLYYLEFGEHIYIKTLKKYFPEDITPSSLHSTILKINPKIILTTNWDCIIENAIEKEGYLYDTISTDKDLVNSTSQNKLIKIHGDFKSHNIVFKEDDYLNYSRNFPLIENYIKSIFSTYTVLFIGYSYNDVNLKHIMKWVQNHSTSAPPMYLISFRANKAQESYLKNHGINTIILNKETFEIKDINHLEERSALIQSFLTIVNHSEKAVESLSKNEIIEYIFERIKHLKQQSHVSQNQIQKSITNCMFHHDQDGLAILELLEPNGIQTMDNCNSMRVINMKFIEEISKLDNLTESKLKDFHSRNPRFDDILSILSLAYIKGIIISKDRKSGQSKYFVNKRLDSSKITEDDRSYISFSEHKGKSHDIIKVLLSESYEAYRIGQYELAFRKNSELIQACKRHRVYSILLIALFNKNSILLSLKYRFSTKLRDNFEKENQVNLQDEFFKFPKSEINKNQVLYDFLTLHYIHQTSYQCTKKILDLTRTIESIKRGGVSFNNDADEPTCKHIDLLMFATKNCILIDKKPAYRAAMKDFVKISILRQSLKETVNLNQYEIYSAINFYSTNDLISELGVFTDEDRKLSLGVSQECVEWIISTILPNLITQLIHEYEIENSNETRFENCVRLLALVALNEDSISIVLRDFSRLIASSSTTIGTYRAINDFLAYQYNIFQTKIDTDILIKILNTLIGKITTRTAHGWDEHAILNHSIDNLYGYIDVANRKYNDKERVENLISTIKYYGIKEQRKYSRSILYSIFCISEDNLQETIKQFIESIISKPNEKDFEDWEFELWACAVEFHEFNKDSIPALDAYIEQFRDGTKFSSKLYSLKRLINHLVDSNNIEYLKPLNNELSKLIRNHEDLPNYSSI